MPEALRLPSGWYEEDCDWARVALAFPERFTPEDVAQAQQTLRSYAPEDFEHFTGQVVSPGESYARDEAIFAMETRTKMVTMAAIGSGNGYSMATKGADVPEGFVEVFAGRGGRTPGGEFPAETAYYLVPEAEYDTRCRFVVVSMNPSEDWSENSRRARDTE